MSNKLPLITGRAIKISQKSNDLSLPLDRDIGDIGRYTYVHSAALPLGLTQLASQKPKPNKLPLNLSVDKGAFARQRWVSSDVLLLPLALRSTNQPEPNRLSLELNRQLRSLISSPTKPPQEQDKPPVQTVSADGIYELKIGEPSAENTSLEIKAVGHISEALGALRISGLAKEGYVTSSGLILSMLSEIALRPPTSDLPFPIRRKRGQYLHEYTILPTNRRYIYTKDGYLSVFGASTAYLKDRYLTVNGFDSFSTGASIVRNDRAYLKLQGWSSSAFSGMADIVNVSRQLYPTGIFDQQLGKPRTFNLRQYAPLQGNNQSLYGIAYVQGGVKHLSHHGHNGLSVGSVSVTNTTANQYAYAYGIARTTVVPAPIITPHMIHARGIYGTGIGNLKAIPTPVLRQKGLNHFEAGKTTVWYHTRPLATTGFESYDTGYPKVFDPTQYFSPSPTLRSSVFGDVRIRNNNSHLRAPSIDSQAISEWATVEARNKTLYARSFVAQAFGSQLIKNKSPSIFFNGLPAPIFYNQAIGYRIRKVSPTGFDRLGLGNPTVIKTPELFPRSYIATQFGTQWVSNRTRHIEQYGRDYSTTGTPIVWFRFRYARPNSWQSSRFSLGVTVTHGVRELIGQGFIQQGYGTAWLSRGIRLLEPQSIYKEYPSNHFVGRHQEIKPVGYIATLFGTRIIPEIQGVYPLGFAGVFGQTVAYLQTQYLKPKGYFSTGDQAFRWGRQIVQNSIQYITQNYAGDNGLVPPKWSEWTAIENRNKTIGAIGTAMQRFGYAQVDNNARLIEPQGLIATRFDKNMIAYRIRYLPLQGIEQPYMSDWLIVHNAARVIKPAGELQSLFGNADIVNTRRYLDRIGRIESFESGTPMIAYRIRKLEIEKRYSIAPPIIRLPTIDLYTRYIEFNGYETAKYGSPSLSIHFRIITPRWTHNEKSGSPALRNVTPELLTRGHDSQEYGNASIRTQWRNVYARGDSTAAIGLLKISDTKQHISVRGFIDSLASQKHTITQGESAPYSLQYIYLNDENNSNNGQGKGIYQFAAGRPAFNQNVLYHRGHRSSSFGTAFMWSNNIVVDSGIAIDGVPKTLIVSNKNNIISLDGKGMYYKMVAGTPRVTPHTIYATTEASEQAQRNNPAIGRLHKVGEYDYGHASSRVGRPFVESTIRTIRPSHFYYASVFGRASLDLKTKKVSVNGFRLSRFGLPSIPFTLQTIGLRAGIYGTFFGAVAVTRPPYTGPQYIDLKGVYSTLFGATYADNYIRHLNARGSDSLAMGQSKHPDTPFMWQGLRIGERVPLIIGAGDTSRHGLTWISLRVREIGAEGFNAFRSEYDLSNFKEHMTVKNADKKLPVIMRIEATGINPSNSIGYQDVKLGQYYIRPDGNSDQFRKGGYHA
ncbi:hypothetical protein [Pseudoalteromonas phage vB_PalP_Y7]|nr:hypothetical protein [Pseudoalteromonas phage vB_PalP_Y7]